MADFNGITLKSGSIPNKSSNEFLRPGNDPETPYMLLEDEAGISVTLTGQSSSVSIGSFTSSNTTQLTGEVLSLIQDTLLSNSLVVLSGDQSSVIQDNLNSNSSLNINGLSSVVNEGNVVSESLTIVGLTGQALTLTTGNLTIDGVDIPIVIPPQSYSGGFVTSRHTRTTIPTSHLVDVEKDDMEIIEII